MSSPAGKVVAGAIRLASGVSFLVAPAAANRAWGGNAEAGSPTESLLLRSMGYRDALIGGLLVNAGLRGGNVSGWLLASAGADAADLLGGVANHDRMTDRHKRIGLGGAVVGIAVGVLGALAERRRTQTR
jgi:hypothetical protein